MRSTLEKALIALLSEDKDQAAALFHDYLISRSRQINESLVQGETFMINESEEPSVAVDATFGESDLEGGEVTEGEGDNSVYYYLFLDFGSAVVLKLTGDAAARVDGETTYARGDDWAKADSKTALLSDMAAHVGIDASALEAKYGAELDQMPAITANDLTIYDGESPVSADGLSDDFDGMDMYFADLTSNSGEIDENDIMFDDLSESLIDDLEKVIVDSKEGATTSGEKVKVNKTSPGLQPKAEDRLKGKPAEIAPDEHNGFDREKTPKVAQMPKRQNSK
jgi:hypothetical protein